MRDATTEITFEQIFSPETRRDPHPLYHQIRSEQPIAYNVDMDDWLLTRWADCIAVLRDPKWSSNPETRGERRFNGPQVPEFADVGVHTMLFLDR